MVEEPAEEPADKGDDTGDGDTGPDIKEIAADDNDQKPEPAPEVLYALLLLSLYHTQNTSFHVFHCLILFVSLKCSIHSAVDIIQHIEPLP